VAELGQADRIRSLVAERYVAPVRRAGSRRLSIRVRDVLGDVAKENFPRGRTPLICEVLQGKKFLAQQGLEIENVEGPPSKQSPTVVVHYRVVGAGGTASEPPASAETPKERAHRLTGKLFGLMKDEIAAHGGAEGYMRWVRSDDDQDAR
jgi:hypothetical protein